MATAIPIMDWLSPNLAETFKLFKQRLELYFKVKSTSDDDKVPILLLAVQEEGLKRYNSWSLTTTEESDISVLFNKFLEQLEPAENFRISRLKLSKYKQQQSESVDSFINRCKLLANKCSFKDDELDDRLIELIIASTTIPEYQKELLNKPKGYKLSESVALGRSYEASASYIATLQSFNTPTANIDAMRNNTTRRYSSKCKNCGQNHKFGRQFCPARNDKCYHCSKLGHWSKLCLTPKNKPDTSEHYRPSKQHHSVTTESQHSHTPTELSEQLETFTFSTIQTPDIRDEAYVTIKIDLNHHEHNFKLKVDTGAQANTMPFRTYRQMYPNKLNSNGDPDSKHLVETNSKLTAYNGSEIECLGKTYLKCKYNSNTWATTEFYIVNVSGPAILGLPSCQSLSVVTLNCSITSAIPTTNNVADLKRLYPDQFDTIGDLNTHKLTVDPNVPARINAPRRTPIAMKDKIKAELDKMVTQQVIRPIEEATDWVSSITCVLKKDNSIRVCLDPRYLNMALIRPMHNIPTVDEINYKLSNATHFSKLDAKAGYWSVKLEEESQKLTTFQTPFGRFCFQRLPFGLSVSQDIFQLEMDRILEKCDGACGIADDVIIYGSSEKEHDHNLINFMNIAKQHGLTLNSQKCSIKQPEISFFGNVYTNKGMKPDPQKIKDLQQMPEPTSKHQVQTFIGFITYLSKFIGDFSTKTAVLRDLLNKDADFVWESHHQKAFDLLKTEVTQNSVLSYYDPHKALELHCDASMRGLGTVLLQPDENGNMKPVSYASKSLTETEQRYACIERELLSIVFAIQRFHTYVYGRDVKVVTDHKPLVMILNKPITSAPPRLQRMLMKLQGYNITIIHKPGSENELADGLSRFPSPTNNHNIDLDIQVNLVRFSTESKVEIQHNTCVDPVLNVLTEIITSGWPNNQKEVPTCIRPYWTFRDQLSIDNGFVLKGQQIVIPSNLRNKIIQQLHTAHLGQEKTKLLARDCVYWPNINRDIDNIVQTCPTCQQHQNAQSPETLHQHEIPSRPWSTVGTDLFVLDNKQWLIVADYYSKYPIVRKLPVPAPSSVVVSATKQIFAEHGIPETVISDNGPHFHSEIYSNFAKEWNFDHVTSSPRYPQSNGFIERQIQTVKSIMKKTKQSNTDLDMALLHWRSTPISNSLPSPAQLLMGRRMRSNITTCIRDNNPQHDQVTDQLSQRQQTQKFYHDRKAHDLPPLYPGQPVSVVNPNTGLWNPAVIKEKCVEPRSYLLSTNNGNIYRRNRHQLRERNPAFQNPTITEPTIQNIPSNNQPVQSQPLPILDNHVPLESPSQNRTVNQKPTDLPLKSTKPQQLVKSPCNRNPIRTRYGREINKPSRFEV